MQCYHLRITAKWSEIEKGLIRDFLTKFEPATYVFSEEVSKQDVIHIHGHIEYEDVPSKSTLSDLFKRYKLSGLYYHKQLVKDKQNNLLYVCKDLNIKLHNLEQYELDEIISKTTQINEDKKKETRHKLLDLYEKWFFEIGKQYIEIKECEITLTKEIEYKLTEFNTYINELDNIAMFINDLYINEWDKEPPLAHLTGYVLYIASKMNNKLNYTNFYDIKKYYIKRF